MLRRVLKGLNKRGRAAVGARVEGKKKKHKAEVWEHRGEYFDQARAETPLLAAESEYGSFIVRTADARIGRFVFVKGHYAGPHLPHALELLEGLGFDRVRDGALLDIGANIGTVAIPAVHRHGVRRAVAFEPHPENVRVLRMNVIYNDLDDRVEVVSCALSDHDGQGRLEVVNPNNYGAHEVAEPGRSRPELDFVDIELRTLDSLEEDGLALDDTTLAWLDVQGHEPRVLAGATRLLSRRTPVVAEFHPGMLRRNGTLDAMLALAAEHFESFVDLRTKSKQPPVEPVADLTACAERIGDRFTDVLLLPPRA